MLDYLIVGLGLAGISFCEQLEENGKTYQVISDGSQTSSSVAGGLYNPVILKRFTLAWNAGEQLERAIPFYQQLENKLNVKLDFKLPILRRFASIEEQNLWFDAMDKPGLERFLSPEILPNDNLNIEAPYGFGKVLHTGRLDTGLLLVRYADYLKTLGLLISEGFDHSLIEMHDGYVSYKTITAKRIVFAEGFGIRNNPYFNYLPLYGTKGEYIIINAPDLKESRAIKSSIFCIPLGDHTYKIGATYEQKDKSNMATAKAKDELMKKLESFVKCDYTVVDQMAGVRPTVGDRKPVVGRHPRYDNMLVLNGLGSRGVLISPYVSLELFEHVERSKTLLPAIDANRFTRKYFKG